MAAGLKLVAGLGNPGARYSVTRHNAGFWFLEQLADQSRLSFSGAPRFSSEMARFSQGDIDCWLAMPQTFMNDSGRAIRAISDYYRIPPEQMLIVHDDIDLEPGVVRLKQGGGHGGHNGLRDIISQLGSNGFLRLRIGVGHPGQRDQVIDSVLSRPGREEQELIDAAIGRALQVMPQVFAGEIARAMHKLHTKEGD